MRTKKKFNIASLIVEELVNYLEKEGKTASDVTEKEIGIIYKALLDKLTEPNPDLTKLPY